MLCMNDAVNPAGHVDVISLPLAPDGLLLERFARVDLSGRVYTLLVTSVWHQLGFQMEFTTFCGGGFEALLVTEKVHGYPPFECQGHQVTYMWGKFLNL